MSKELLAAFLSGGFLVFGSYFLMKANHLLRYGKKAKGFVFANNFKRVYTSKNAGLYFPVIRFKTESEEWITQELEIGYNPPKEEGEKVKVLYDPDDPQHIQLDSTFVLVFLPRVLISIGFIGFVLSLLMYLELVVIN